ncbi:hypothetical protein E3N88_21077 [Mikania micrantha]|uniref:Uncharacterized protein n=1 Tax=Mikania micrantha TaxID=192012 RepID=A0A5N6NJB0_9ASTR|nr:hypothetical protein E3N88_21077 [Mikania micrantha]
MQSSTIAGVSPSFAAHSSNNLADVAARVVEEFRQQNGDDYDDIFNFNDYDYDDSEFSAPAVEESYSVVNPETIKAKNDCDHDDDEFEFEFAVVCNDVNLSPISADEIFSQGHIMPRYPLFDRSLLLDVDPDPINVVNDTAETECKSSSLRKLFSEDRDFGSSSSSEADDLNGITPGSYCVWKPKTESPERCKKSNSTGNSSRRWKFRDILYRSNSDGKESPFLLFKPLITTNKKISNEKVKKIEKLHKVSATVGHRSPAVKNIPTNKAENKVNRRQLPAGQALADAFTTVSRFNKNLHL